MIETAKGVGTCRECEQHWELGTHQPITTPIVPKQSPFLLNAFSNESNENSTAQPQLGYAVRFTSA